jgi:hypothetical protein
MKNGQIAHIDRDAKNSTLANAAWLCLLHHNRYDSTSRQAKGLTAPELRSYKALLVELLKDPRALEHAPKPRRTERSPGISLEIYDRRKPTYDRTIDFLRVVIRGGRLDPTPVMQFAADTDDALFLFDDNLATYLRHLFKEALKLYVVSSETHSPERRTRELADEEVMLLGWFADQFEEARRRFAPYLRLK